MKKLFLLLMTVCLTCTVALAQAGVIKGKVVSAGQDEPLPGATVMAPNGQGAATNIDGEFTLKVEPGTVLSVSYVGYETAKVPAADGMTVKLRENNTLDEVMVVAYGTAKKAAFTGSAVTIDANTIEQAPVTNVLSVLNGKMPGAQLYTQSGAPGSGPSSIVIRGFGSLNAGMQPLIVLDGVPYGGSITDINTNDIESLTVLKDAASTALYGARGANGVILITTKKANNNSNGTVTLDASWGLNTRATQDYNLINNPALYYETYYKSLQNYYMAAGQSVERAWVNANANIINNSSMGLGYQVYNVPTGQMFIGLNGKINPNAHLGNLVTYKGEQYYLTPDNWLDETYSSSLRQEYNLTVTNSNDKTNFYASFGYLKTEGIISNTDYSRLTGRLSADSQIKSWLKAGANASFSHFKGNSMSADGSSNSTANPLAMATSIAPIYPMYVRDGKGQIIKNGDHMTMYDFGSTTDAPGIGRPTGAFSGANGMSNVLYNTNTYKGNNFNANGFLEIRFLKDFKFTTNNTIFVDETRSNYVGNKTFGGSVGTGGYVSVSHSRGSEYTFQQLLEWTRSFGMHEVQVLVGHENAWTKSTYIGANRTQLFSDKNPELAGAVVDGSMDSYASESNREGYIVRGMYEYNNKYFANAYYRRDASSRFHPDHRWGNFWALGGAWMISNEEWFQAPWVNALKIKASYGETGNDGIGSYRYTNTYTVTNVGGFPSLVASSVKGNPNITWETTGTFNFGVEFSLFNDRLSGTIEPYYSKTRNMLYQKPLAASTGYSNVYENFGDMCNYGIDIDLRGGIIRTRDWTWDITLNVSHLKNKVLRLPKTNRSQEVNGHWGNGSGGFFIGEGLPLYSYFSAKYAGVDAETGVPMFWGKDKDADGKEIWVKKTAAKINSSTDYQITGNAIPKISGGFGTNVRWRDIDLSMSFTYQLGGKVTDGAYSGYMGTIQSSSRGSAIHADMLNCWTPENTNTDVPRMRFGDDFSVSSDRFLTSASYLNFQNLSAGYSLPRNAIREIGLEKVRIYVSCENVWLWSKRQGFDPRTYALGVDTSHALSGGNAYNAAVRTISGGINVTF